MDKYAHRLHDWLESSRPGFEVRLAAHIGDLTRERDDSSRRGRSSGEFVRWWNQEIDPSRIVLPGPFYAPHRLAARHFFYPQRLRGEARRAALVHILDHSYAHLLHSCRKRPVVVTVHDLMPVIVLRSPEDGWREALRNRLLRSTLKALRSASAFIVGTEWLRKELATWLGDDKRIHVVPFGVDRAFFREAPGGGSGAARSGGFRKRRSWCCTWGARWSGRTCPSCSTPWPGCATRRTRISCRWEVGSPGDQEQMIDRLGLRRFVRSIPAADETTLRRAYRAADVLLFPSLYEGFGFPVLEAFASGLPVVMSGAGGLKEVGGDAAVVVEGRDPAAYVQALADLAGDPDGRDALIEKGSERAREFSWQKTANETAEVYRKLL